MTGADTLELEHTEKHGQLKNNSLSRGGNLGELEQGTDTHWGFLKSDLSSFR